MLSSENQLIDIGLDERRRVTREGGMEGEKKESKEKKKRIKTLIQSQVGS